MSELFDGYNEDDTDEFENYEDEREIDPATVAFLDQEEAAFEQHKAEFRRVYGFDHDCRCSQDYTEGNLKEVTECFMNLTRQAMQRAGEATYELYVMGSVLETMLKLNNDLIDMLRNLGHEDELEAYLNQEVELDEPTQAELDGLYEDDDPEQFEGTLADGLDDVEADQ